MYSDRCTCHAAPVADAPLRSFVGGGTAGIVTAALTPQLPRRWPKRMESTKLKQLLHGNTMEQLEHVCRKSI